MNCVEQSVMIKMNTEQQQQTLIRKDIGVRKELQTYFIFIDFCTPETIFVFFKILIGNDKNKLTFLQMDKKCKKFMEQKILKDVHTIFLNVFTLHQNAVHISRISFFRYYDKYVRDMTLPCISGLCN